MSYADDERAKAYNRAYMRAKRKQMYLGTWEGRLIDAAPAREHVLALNRMGMSYREIAYQIGESNNQISVLVYESHKNHVHKITRRRHDRIMALKFDLDALRPTAKVPAVGTQRRVRALQAMGWSTHELGKRLGVSGSTVSFYQADCRIKVYAGIARKVRDLYDELSMTPGPSQRCRTMAHKRGYAGPLCWDEDSIDDPEAKPLGMTEKHRQPKRVLTDRSGPGTYTCPRCGVRATFRYGRKTGLCQSCVDETRGVA